MAVVECRFKRLRRPRVYRLISRRTRNALRVLRLMPIMRPMRIFSQQVAPGEVDSEVARCALSRVESCLVSARGKQVAVLAEMSEDSPLPLPTPVMELLAFSLATMADGRGVRLIPVDAILTTQQAADLMQVSRPYLIGLLERGEIAYSTVGRHRRINFNDLVQYMNEDDQRRLSAADELTRMDEELESA